MSNFSDFFPAAGGGGGGIPKYQEFTTSGTFTPSQELIDAGGRIAYFIISGGQRGTTGYEHGGAGGGIEWGYMTLTSTSSCTVTIGAAGGDGSVPGNSSVAFSSAGGTDITANAPVLQYSAYSQVKNTLGTGWGNAFDNSMRSSAGSGFFGYGAGGSSLNNSYHGGIMAVRANSGQGSPPGVAAADGFVRITWFE